MDEIDRNRITKILKKRDAGSYELWDLLDNTVLANGENALTYYNQLVKVRTVSGQTFVPKSGSRGVALQPESGITTVNKRGPGRPSQKS
jgi:hypothetical protein